MTNNSKTFRLFISSTFSDFQVERETLQTKIFPEIKEYCSNQGYTFQPIDLRWGVSNEAQLDQKALEMCIKEVQSSKRHDYPNFLIMLGDRYGWIPLPNIIESSEFETIIENVKTNEEKELLSEWYYEDKNQIPTSYVLKERTDVYIEYDKWLEVEFKLRDIFQSTVKNLDDNIKSKYNTSATESEAIEGIISYFSKTEYQQKLLQLMPELEQQDHKHIFGFFRDIDKDTIIENKFISEDYDKAQGFKDKVKNQLIKENILDVSTSQISKEKLYENYLDEFIKSVTQFLKSQVDIQITKDKEKNYTNLELEKQQQYNYLNQKLENFLGQETVLDKIQNYINNDDTKPLIICGESGIGKSSIVAKSIEDTSNTSNKKIIYRFVGATPNSTTTKDLLNSILEELNISIENENQDNIENQFLTDIDNEENSFVKFSHQVYDEIQNLKDDIVIFIDAIDQLSNDDQFLWLPNNLPSNIKIVISALKDRNYKEDSKYFYTLEDKISSYIEIEPFNKPIELLESLLSQQNRTLQDQQKEYFLTQYSKVNTPLYAYMAANQMQYWKSSDVVDTDVTLSITQKEIVKEFIDNLTKINHHNKQLAQKVFGYILASKDGLSEYEILELLNTDKEFIKTIAPDTWHTNTTQELPLVIWTRLYNHIKPFLNRKNQDGQELLYFFHREFIDVIQNQDNQNLVHWSIIKATQKLIEKYQDQEFDSNRWGKLYATLLAEHFLKYGNEEIVLRFCTFVNNMNNNDNWIFLYIENIQKLGQKLNINNKLNISLAYRKIALFTLQSLHNHSIKWSYLYIQASHNIASTYYNQNKIDKSIEIGEKNLSFVKKAISEPSLLLSVQFIIKHTIKNEDITGLALYYWTDSQIKILSVLSSCYSSLYNLEKAIEIDERALELSEHFYNSHKDNQFFWRNHYLIALGNLADSLQQNLEFERAIEYQQKALDIVDKEHNKDTGYLMEDYARILNGMSALLANKKPEESKELLNKSHEILSILYHLNPNRYANQLHIINSNKISIGIDNDDIDDLEQYYYQSIKILETMENAEKEKWIEDYSNNLLLKSHDYYKEGNVEQSTKCLILNKRVIEVVFKQYPNSWAKFYIQKLLALGSLLSKNKIDNKQLLIAESLQKEGIEICEKYMTEDDEWYDLYTKNMNNLANTYTYLNKKSESYLLNKKNLEISNMLFQKDQQKWFRAYYCALENMAANYFYNSNDEKEKECRDKIKELESNPSFQFEKNVVNNVSTNKKIKYFDYFYKSLLMLGIFFMIKYLIFE
jgi:hypothetical protein